MKAYSLHSGTSNTIGRRLFDSSYDSVQWTWNTGKELSFCHKLEISNPYIFATGWRKPLIFQTYMIWSNRNHSLKYLRSMSLGWKDIGIRKSKLVAKTQFVWQRKKRRLHLQGVTNKRKQTIYNRLWSLVLCG